MPKQLRPRRDRLKRDPHDLYDGQWTIVDGERLQ
jgi:hypothetical protein